MAGHGYRVAEVVAYADVRTSSRDLVHVGFKRGVFLNISYSGLDSESVSWYLSAFEILNHKHARMEFLSKITPL